MSPKALFLLIAVVSGSLQLRAQGTITPERLQNAAAEPHNYLTYGGDFASRRYSALTQLTPENVNNLRLSWVYQSPMPGSWEATPVVADGIMYVSQRMNDIVALDAVTGRVFWIYSYPLNAEEVRVCCGANNRGLAILGDTLFMGTLDAAVVAVDAKSGKQLWKAQVGSSKVGDSITHAPLALKDRVIVGMSGGETGSRGFIAALSATTGKELWRFYTIPAPGEPGHETWEPCPPNSPIYCDPESWKRGGGNMWVTGSYDPELNLTYWGTGNPGTWNSHERPGDNLYSTSAIALDVDTGKLKWHYQFTPHDRYDFDATQAPVLVDMTWQGAPLKAVLWANRNGIFYVLDRRTGRFLLGKPFTRINWMSGFDANGRPLQTPQPPDLPTYPAIQGGTNWYSPSYSPRTGWFYVTTWQDIGVLKGSNQLVNGPRGLVSGPNQTFVPYPDQPLRGIPGAQQLPAMNHGPINNWTEAAGHGEVLAIDPSTADIKWRYRTLDVSDSGVITTASDLAITGGREGYLQILDARTGRLLWRTSIGAIIRNNPITYAVNGKQYVTAIAGVSMFTFALPN